MSVDLYPLRVLLTTLAGWMNRQQQDVIAYLAEEDRVLEERLEGKRLRLDDGKRRRLATPTTPRAAASRSRRAATSSGTSARGCARTTRTTDPATVAATR